MLTNNLNTHAYNRLLNINEDLLQKYSSMIEIRAHNYTNEAVAVRRLLQCVAATLALNGNIF